MCAAPSLGLERTRMMESAGNESGGGGGGAAVVSAVNDTSADGSLDDFYESGEGASMLLFEFILHGIFTNLGCMDLAE